MASSSEDIPEASTSQTEDEHKDKKKKFRPLEKMRKFFKSSKKATKSKDSVKAKSTGALHKDTEQSEDDDDGGFAGRPMGGARSISEDSVFKPGEKEGGLDAIKQTAVSMEQVNQQFRSSPTGKSTSRESDNSLISVDGSENEEDDLFSSNWKSSIASVKTPEDNSSKKEPSSMDFDLSTVKRDTQTLTSDAAKHRISIKPKTRRSSMPRRGADRTTASHLPRVSEETTKQATDRNSTGSTQDHVTSIKVSAPPKKEDLPKDIKPEVTTTVKERRTSAGTSEKAVEKDDSISTKEKSQITGTPVSNKDSQRLQERKSEPLLRGEEVKSVKPRPKSLVDAESTGVKEESNELSKAFKRMSLRREMGSPEETPVRTSVEPVKEVKEISVSGSEVSEVKTPKSPVKTEPQTLKLVDSKTPKSPTAKDAPGTGKTTYVLKKEPLRTSSTSKSPEYENLEDLKFNKNVTSPSSDYENFPIGGFKSVKSELSSPEPDYDNLPVKYPLSPTAEKFLPKEVEITSKAKTSTMPQKLSSPREEYRLKRQPRSRTLPEQPISREILDSKTSESPQEIMNSKSPNVDEKSVTSSTTKRTPSKTNSFKENNSSLQNRFSGSLTSALSEKLLKIKLILNPLPKN
uniref:Muscle M-line assembly protein unc-89-like isoform X2 n=1 Tax=Crassostrea virginica TaxID=6565 RepID=A0A8B8D9Z4_CRAVI|nr:muscle M-line assembly protein unc-89-like isoform X2 [Crassostrea virginica]